MVADAAAHRIEIEYCTQCRWMLRAAWLAQELLTTFRAGRRRGRARAGQGRRVRSAGSTSETVWSRVADGGFPQPKELKQRVRDVVAPGRSLGHSDR